VSRREGRVWLFAPTNQFGGYRLPFLKGTVEPGYTSVPRYFLGQRLGSTPAAMGCEAQVVWLVPVNELRRVATSSYDAPILAALPPVRKSVARSRSASGSGSPGGTAGAGGDGRQ
jgi:hypothetical protein